MSKILIVEDDENILELEKDYIEASNMEAQGATNGNDGLELALNNDYDLILLDVMLPGINGFDICKKIRETKNTPVIFVTAKREDVRAPGDGAFRAAPGEPARGGGRPDRKSTRLNSSHITRSRMPSSA